MLCLITATVLFMWPTELQRFDRTIMRNDCREYKMFVVFVDGSEKLYHVDKWESIETRLTVNAGIAATKDIKSITLIDECGYSVYTAYNCKQIELVIDREDVSKKEATHYAVPIVRKPKGP